MAEQLYHLRCIKPVKHWVISYPVDLRIDQVKHCQICRDENNV